jgi:hypothetical protein
MTVTNFRNPGLIPVKTVRRPTKLWTSPPPATHEVRVPVLTNGTRIAIEVRAEIDQICSRLPKFGPVVVPESGLCHKPIHESFQGHTLDYWCVQAPGHEGSCAPEQVTRATAEVLKVLPLDHHDAHGCLDAPTVTP